MASTESVAAAAAQCQALGFSPVHVFVAHPIQDRSHDEIRALVEVAVDEVLTQLVDR